MHHDLVPVSDLRRRLQKVQVRGFELKKACSHIIGRPVQGTCLFS